ncbi:MAG: S8 family serine peptidase [Paenibacillaceae bacterium]
MNLKKALISSFVVIALTATSFSAVFGESLKETDLKQFDPIYKKAVSTESTFTESLKSRRIDPKLDKIKQTKQNSKKRGKLTEKYNKASLTEHMNVEIALNFNASEENFERKLKELKLTYKKIRYQTYESYLNKNQIDLVESMDDVMILNLSDPNDYDYLTDVSNDDSDYLTLNAATEMTGTKKARTDYGVTGNFDGNETTYSNNDIVIAVIDTGIDATHVDLDGGKVIGWFDAVNGSTTASDTALSGHGTHVASIIAGTGEGDPVAGKGFAPGAALVGVKVCDPSCLPLDIEQGLQWIWDNRTTFNIDAVNMSIGSQASLTDRQAIVDLINDLNNVGVEVFVTAGNEGNGLTENGVTRYYDTLSTYAEYTNFSVGSVKDPYEGGWGLSEFSSRGTGSLGPWVVSTGQNIRAAQANSTDGYILKSGTSMAAPSVVGIYALMLDALLTTGINQGGSLQFYTENFGILGFDKNYGNGNVLGYPSIQRAAGSSSGSFNDFRDHIIADHTINAYQIDYYNINVYGTGAAFNTTLLILDEIGEDLDLYIWAPGADPNTDAPIASSTANIELPQEYISIASPSSGTYTIGVLAYDQSRYSLDFSGQINIP